MVHLRVVAPPAHADHAHDVLCRTDSVVNVIRMPDAASEPDGDVILCDVAREDASVVIADLHGLGIDEIVDLHRDGRHPAVMLSLTTAKSGALIGVLISVTTIPAAANIAVAFVYSDWPAWRRRHQARMATVTASSPATTRPRAWSARAR